MATETTVQGGLQLGVRIGTAQISPIISAPPGAAALMASAELRQPRPPARPFDRAQQRSRRRSAHGRPSGSRTVWYMAAASRRREIGTSAI